MYLFTIITPPVGPDMLIHEYNDNEKNILW